MSRRSIDWVSRCSAALPRGVALPEDVFASRHLFLVRILAIHALVIVVAGGVIQGWAHGLLEALPIVGLAIAGQRFRGREGRWPVSVGLLVSSATLVHLSGGLIEMHFHFFVIVSLVALYRNWPTLLTTVGFVALHHGIVGTVAPSEVYNHPTAIAHPWVWACIHALLILFSVIVCSTWWRYSELAETHASALAREQERVAFNARRTAALRAQLDREQATVERLEELEELRATFLQAVSHELRTPLTSIVGFAALLKEHDDRLDATQRARLTSRLCANADRLSRLLTDLLDVDRLTAGREVLNRADADLADAVSRVVAEAQVRDHRIEVDTTGRRLVMAIDVAKFERIVDNLVRNAVKHTPPGSHIQVQIERAGGGALLTVSDDGPGIASQLRTRLLEPFEQGPEARHASSPGTGIGLTLVSRFAELHGGRAWIDDSPTGGARIRVHLPDPSTLADRACVRGGDITHSPVEAGHRRRRPVPVAT